MFLLPLSAAAKDNLFLLLSELRKKSVSAELYCKHLNLKKGLKAADECNAKYAVIMGESEMASGSVLLKNLATHEQRMCNRNTVLAELLKELQL